MKRKFVNRWYLSPRLKWAWLWWVFSVQALAQSAPLQQVSYNALLQLDTREPDQRLSYGPAKEQTAALWLPDSAVTEAPVVVFVHGGCWLNAYSREHSDAFSTALAAQGFAVWSLEYRRAGDEGGGWPGSLQDVIAGINALTVSAPATLDLGRVILVGHSAGGHLSLLASQQPLHLTPLAVFGLAAITDPELYAKGDNGCQKSVLSFMGGDATHMPEAYLRANTLQAPSAIPVVLMHSKDDKIVPVEQAQQAAAHWRIEWQSGAGHFDWIHPQTPAFELFIQQLQQVVSL